MQSELILTCQECGGANPRPLPYHMAKPDRCDHCPAHFTTRMDILRLEVLHLQRVLHQSKWGSFIEACANTAVGYVIALVCMRIIMWAYGFPMGTRETSIVVFWMTGVSVVRGYLIRRLWNSQFWKRWRRGH